MNPLLHWGNWGIIRGFDLLDILGGLGISMGHPSHSQVEPQVRAPKKHRASKKLRRFRDVFLVQELKLRVRIIRKPIII